jgi:hypothetical protein
MNLINAQKAFVPTTKQQQNIQREDADHARAACYNATLEGTTHHFGATITAILYILRPQINLINAQKPFVLTK